MSSATVTKQI